MEENEVNFWNKKPVDLTVADQLKYAGLVTVVCTAGPIVALVIVGEAASLWEKVKKCRARKLDEAPKQ